MGGTENTNGRDPFSRAVLERCRIFRSNHIALLILTFLLVVGMAAPAFANDAMTQVTSDGQSSYAVGKDGVLWVWGSTMHGQAGDPTNKNPDPLPWRFMEDVSLVEAGYSCAFAIKRDGTLWSWGYSGSRSDGLQLGIPFGNAAPFDISDPEKIMDDVAAVKAGYMCGYALKRDGTLWSWGRNSDGELGDGTGRMQELPVQIMTDVVDIEVGDSCAYAIKRDGTLWEWGWRSYGGDNIGSIGIHRSPHKVLDDVKQVAPLADRAAYAVKNDGTLWGWGAVGLVGDGTNERSYSPIKIMDDVRTVSAGGFSAYAIKNDGTLWGWGTIRSSFAFGSQPETHLAPVKMMDGVADVHAGTDSYFVMKRDGSLWGWGSNEYGQLGVGDVQGRPRPVKIMDSVSWVATNNSFLGATTENVFAMKPDGSMWAWGLNANGALGDGTRKDRYAPVRVTFPDRVDISKAEVMLYQNEFTYTGKPVEPSLIYVQVKTRNLAEGTDYTISFKDNVEPGVGTVLITGRFRYQGTATVPFTISDPNKVPDVKDVTVTFASNGGSAVAAQKVEQGKRASRPADPARSGYCFKGWFSDAKLTRAYDFNAAVIGDLTLYAKWEKAASPTPSTGFSDVAASHWAYTEGWLPYVTSHKLMGGYNGKFAPEGTLTRGQVAAVLYRIANPGSDATTNPAHYGSDTGFSDGGEQRYYYAAVKWLKAQGISTGDKDQNGNNLNRFRPDDRISRQELAALVYRFATKMGAEGGADASWLGRFKDGAAVQPYAREAMAWCNANGIVSGFNGTLAPNADATRAQAAKIFSVVHRDVLKK